jgi:hypothetical protein
MKYLIFLSLCLTAFITANPTQETHNSQHTYLVKTDLTKEQVENLLNEYHRNHTTHAQETTTLHQNKTGLFHPNEHQNETTHLKVKKQKKNKQQNQEMNQEPPKEKPIEQPQVKNEVVEVPEPKEAPEAPEAPEQPEAPEAPEVEQPETPEVKNETTNLKKKNQNTQKNQHQHGIKEAIAPLEEEIQKENTTELKQKSEEKPENKTELMSNAPCANETTNLMSKNEHIEVKQNNSLIFVIFASVFFAFAFICLFVYLTMYLPNPKARKKINEKFNELTDYLLVKDDQRKKYDLRDF